MCVQTAIGFQGHSLGKHLKWLIYNSYFASKFPKEKNPTKLQLFLDNIEKENKTKSNKTKPKPPTPQTLKYGNGYVFGESVLTQKYYKIFPST